MEEGYEEAGYRNAWQVLCNSAAALGAGFAWNAMFVPGSMHAWLAGVTEVGVSYSSAWCPLDGGVAGGWSRGLVFAVIG